MTEITQATEATEVRSESENIEALQILQYTDYELFDINRHCSMITKNKCSHSFQNNEDLIMCGSCDSKFCYECRRKGVLHVEFTTVVAGLIEFHQYSQCPICDKVGFLMSWKQELSINRRQNQCTRNKCTIS
tara:strand:- start:194 stop:589 length:396 start_codon:yes stop_codon:yes gene_type:complete